MILFGADYFVYYEDLPRTVRGVVTPNDDATFSVYINKKLDEASQRKALAHEVHHIENDDFYNGRPLYEIEGLNETA